MKDKRKEIIEYCLTFVNAYEDYPFEDKNWCVIRHRDNRKVFAWIFEKDGSTWINLKCDPSWSDFWRSTYKSVIPAYHLNKIHWNSVILDGTVPESDVQSMIRDSFNLTTKKPRKQK